MKLNLVTTIALSVVLLGAGYFVLKSDKKASAVIYSPLYTIYTVEGHPVELIGGKSETQIAPGSSTKIITRYFGNQKKYDFNKDGKEDVVFILTQETGGSGTFYYLVAAINTGKGFTGSEGFFLGDRISPQTTEIGSDGIVVVNFAERLIGESFANVPSVGKTRWFKFNTAEAKFIEVPQPLGKGAIASEKTLDIQKWTWVSTTYGDGKKITPKDPTQFVLVFKNSSTFSATTDCNGIGGEYTLKGNNIVFNSMIASERYCDRSQESDFTKTLSEVAAYHFGSSGELIFDLKFDSGSAIFK